MNIKKKGHKLDLNEIRRAYFHAKARRPVYVQLPFEDQLPGYCGKLLMSLYGTRDAAQNWEFEYAEFLKDCGFAVGQAVTCLFHHAQRDIRLAVHGDDFTVLGPESRLNWFREQIAKKFEVKLRGRDNDDKSIRLLNRVFEWNENGIYIY